MTNKSDTQKKVFLSTFGCQMNVRDSELVLGLLKKSGFKPVDLYQEADVVIINTCSVRQHAEDRVWSQVGAFKKTNSKNRKSPLIGIIGCMAQNYKEKIFVKSPDVDFAVGPADIDKIPAIIKELRSNRGLFEKKLWETDGLTRPEPVYHNDFYAGKKHAYVVISEGCSNYCSYCIVPYVRGNLRHRHYKNILKEIRAALNNGVTSITLLGQNVNSYRDGSVDFIKLLELVNSFQGLKELSFLTSHPKGTNSSLFKAIATLDRLKKELHLPLQSGSDRILKLMNRGYSRKDFLDLTLSYRKIVKGGLLSSDIIVGFPGESEADFKDTYDLVKKISFDSAYIFKYSPRPQTKASTFTDDITKPEKEKRHKLILDLQRSISGKKCEK